MGKKKVVSPISKPTFKIENIVASASLGLELDLYTIASKLKNVEYEPEQFPGAILKFKDPHSSLLLFKNGKIICTGTKSEKEVKKSIEKTYDLIRRISKKKVRRKGKLTFKVENIVASSSLGVELDLYTIATKLKNVEYEPEQFPGAILKFKEPHSSLLLFKNGKIICTGTKSGKEVQRALNKTAKLLAPYSKKLKTKKPKKK